MQVLLEAIPEKRPQDTSPFTYGDQVVLLLWMQQWWETLSINNQQLMEDGPDEL